jgi:hypothetical protein
MSDAIEGTEELGEASGGPQETPDYFVGDYTADDVAGYLGQMKEMPGRLRELETGFRGQVGPLQQRLEELQSKFATQPVFEPKLERTMKALADYDPRLAEVLKDSLVEDLRGSMSVSPMDRTALEPHITPMLQEMYQGLSTEVANSIIQTLPFDVNGLVNRDPQGNAIAPTTDLQKAFQMYWDQAPLRTQEALTTPGLGFAQALIQFHKWNSERIKGQGAAAGDASSRLASGRQPGRTLRAVPAAPREEAAFDDGFNAVMAAMGKK